MSKRNGELTERRLQVAAALSRQDMSEAERRRLRHAFMEKYGVADRTIRRWLAVWRQEGATGMANKRREGKASILPEEVVKAAIVLRQEEPQRSISNIITILEEEGMVERSFLKRSTRVLGGQLFTLDKELVGWYPMRVMARPIRVEYPNAVYHVTARGNEKKTIYRDDSDRERFLAVLGEAVERFGVIVHAYCLLSDA